MRTCTRVLLKVLVLEYGLGAGDRRRREAKGNCLRLLQCHGSAGPSSLSAARGVAEVRRGALRAFEQLARQPDPPAAARPPPGQVQFA